MPSSTSSFKSRPLPKARWLMAWVLAAFLVVGGLVTGELFWRSLGHQPSVVDDMDLWMLHRNGLGKTRREVVVLGASRVQLGFSTEAFHRRWPGRPLSVLAVEGTSPLASLEDLAAQEAFRGTVICSLAAEHLGWTSQEDYVVYARKHNRLNLKLNRVLASWFQERLTVINPYLNLKRVAEELAAGAGLPRPNYVKTLHDRSRIADYSRVDAEGLYQDRTAKMAREFEANIESDRVQWDGRIQRLEHAAAKIAARGGKVVLLRMPTSGRALELEEAFYPRAVFWDSIPDGEGFIKLHAADYPEFDGLSCPDGTHLDGKDAVVFTAALLGRLDEVLRSPER